jgi:hypothetical protein
MGDGRSIVRGDHGWVRAEFKHDDAEEEAGDDAEQDDDASHDDAPYDFEEDEFQDEGAAEAH